MKNILSGALTLGVISLMSSGCILVDGGDNGGGAPTGNIELSWSTMPGCPTGNTVELIAVESGGTRMFTNLYDCTAGTGIIDDLPVGAYDVFINVTDGQASPTLLAQSFSEANVQVIAGQVVTLNAFTILIDDGFFEFDWAITENGTTVPNCSAFIAAPMDGGLGCTTGGTECNLIGGQCDLTLPPPPPEGGTTFDGACRVPGDDIEIVADIVNDTVAYTTNFPCAPTGTGRAPAPVAAYSNLVFWLTDINTNTNEVPVIRTNPVSTVVEYGNQLVNLGTVDFAFTTN